MKVCTRDTRPRFFTPCPKKGEQGDLTIESMAASTSIDSIIKRYGGNLAELLAWQNKGNFGDVSGTPLDLVDALAMARSTKELIVNSKFNSLEEAIKSLEDGSSVIDNNGNIVDNPSFVKPDVVPDVVPDVEPVME